MTDVQEWLLLSSAEPYGHRVIVRADMVTSVSEVGVMQYGNGHQPEGVKGSRFVHTVGGNLLNVLESADEIMAMLRDASGNGLRIRNPNAERDRHTGDPNG